MVISLFDIVVLIYYLFMVMMVVYVILDNRPPLKTLSWILVLLFLPVAGLIFYFYFGHNFRKEKLFEGKKKLDFKRISRIVKEQSLDLSVHDSSLTSDVRKKINIILLLLGNGKSRLSKRNIARVLTDGKETYDTIFQSIEKARDHIHLEYYIFEDGRIANRLVELLLKKIKEGVKVRFIYDKVGSWSLSNELLRKMEEGGVKTAPFRPVKFPMLTSKVNYRNHRKILIVDGKTGFLGGINIADKYIESDPVLNIPWRDTHLQLDGDAVNDLQLIFLTDWYFLTDEQIKHENRYFPDYLISEECYIQVLASGPDTDYRGIMKAYFAAICSAHTSIHIVSPYFIPNESVLTALLTAAMSGVDVSIILPGISDSKIVQYSSQSYFEELLEAGVKLYRYKRGFIHAKLLMVDGILSTIGTANMDFRSFEQNMEVNAIIYDRLINKKLVNQFQVDLQSCSQLNLSEWKKRSRFTKVKESIFRLFAPLM